MGIPLNKPNDDTNENSQDMEQVSPEVMNQQQMNQQQMNQQQMGQNPQMMNQNQQQMNPQMMNQNQQQMNPQMMNQNQQQMNPQMMNQNQQQMNPQMMNQMNQQQMNQAGQMVNQMNPQMMSNAQMANQQMVNAQNQMVNQQMAGEQMMANGQLNNQQFNSLVPVNLDKDGLQVIPEDTEGEVSALVSKIHAMLRQSPEVQRLANEIDFSDQAALSEFGGKPAEEISTFADRILSHVKGTSVENSGVLLKQLTKIMNSFDRKELEDRTGVLQKFFGNVQKQIEKIVNKYQTFGGEMDKINREITQYRGDLLTINNDLEALYSQNFLYYQELEKYIVAGTMFLEQVKANELPALEQQVETSGDQMDGMKLQSMKDCIEALEDRVHQLELAKIVSLQTAPQVRMIQKGNYKLIAKIQSAFVVTIPLFKIGLTQAIALKRQKIIADSMNALDETTNKLLMKNAQNAANQSKELAKMSTGSVKLETLVESWQIIKSGIEETRTIEEENKKIRESGTIKLRQLQEDIHHQMIDNK